MVRSLRFVYRTMHFLGFRSSGSAPRHSTSTPPVMSQVDALSRPNLTGLQPNGSGLQPTSDGLQPPLDSMESPKICEVITSSERQDFSQERHLNAAHIPETLILLLLCIGIRLYHIYINLSCLSILFCDMIYFFFPDWTLGTVSESAAHMASFLPCYKNRTWHDACFAFIRLAKACILP